MIHYQGLSNDFFLLARPSTDLTPCGHERKFFIFDLLFSCFWALQRLFPSLPTEDVRPPHSLETSPVSVARRVSLFGDPPSLCFPFLLDKISFPPLRTLYWGSFAPSREIRSPLLPPA